MRDRILRGAAAMGIELSREAAEGMAAYWRAVLEANQTLNLTRIVEEDEACAMHFLDSLSPLLWGRQIIGEGAEVLDVGTGAGFPGVPLALARPDIRATLLDARAKRLTFIDTALKEAGVRNAHTVHARAEEHKKRYPVVCARAVAPLPKLCAWLLPLVAPGGVAVMWKGPGADAEMGEAAQVCQKNGAVLKNSFFYDLPEMQRKHRLVVAEMSKY